MFGQISPYSWHDTTTGPKRGVQGAAAVKSTVDGVGVAHRWAKHALKCIVRGRALEKASVAIKAQGLLGCW